MSESNFPIKLEASAKAELRGEIPSHALGRAVDGLMDALSPLTEGLGLVGDSIRTHRVSQVIKRAAAAKQLIDEANRDVRGAPLKFIAPWAEAVSLEDENSELNGMWEKLLANASTSYESRYNLYIDTLKRMSGEEARLLKEICRFGEIEPQYELDKGWYHIYENNVSEIVSQLHFSEMHFPPEIRPLTPNQSATALMPHDLSSIFLFAGDYARLITIVALPTVMLMPDGSKKINNGGLSYRYRPEISSKQFLVHALVREGLAYVDRIPFESHIFGERADCALWTISATEIGVDLVRTCTRLKV